MERGRRARSILQPAHHATCTSLAVLLLIAISLTACSDQNAANVTVIPTIVPPTATLTASATSTTTGRTATATSTTPAATPTARPDPTIPSGAPPVYRFRIVATFPHDLHAFTQGLDIEDGVLYEGTGLNGESSLRRVDLATGEVVQQVNLDPQYFGEGIVVLRDRIFQITWQSQVAFVYDRDTFDLLETFQYETEGWGITSDGQRLVMSDGSSTLYFRDPDTFAELSRVVVSDGGAPVTQLNELEWVNGEVWANVWQTDRIVRIDPGSGTVLGWIDLTGLLQASDRVGGIPDVLNGIAIDDDTGKIYVTGKLWPVIYEIELVEP